MNSAFTQSADTHDQVDVLGLAGRIGAGKTTIATYLVKRCGFKALSFADVVIAPEILAAGEEVNRRTLQRWGASLFRSLGEDGMVAVLAEHIRDSGRYVVDDIRYPRTAEYFRTNHDAKLLFAETALDTRASRVRARGRDAVMNTDDLAIMDEAATELHIPELRPLADYIIVNDGDLADLYSEVDKALWTLFRLAQ